jgi:glycosyltransferase involved in cell wall biosynthesis
MRREHSFLFLGARADVPEILACCDIAVLPSMAEGLSNALLEYMAAGLPVVATRVGGNVEVVTDNETGLLVPPEDDKALASAILRLLRDPGLARRLGESGKDQVRENFSYEQLIRQVDQLYGKLLAQREGHGTA